MKKFLWIAFLSFCFSGVAAESDWNADSVQVDIENISTVPQNL